MLRPIKLTRTRLNHAMSFALGLLASSPASANPDGMQVVTGTVTSTTPNSQTLEITNSPGAILNWQGFDIGTDEITRFIQQDTASAVLNRVTTQNSSEIFGQLLSNGQVFLINSAGILIGRDAVVDTAGMVLSTLNIKDADFTAGHYKFEGSAASGTIANHGYIKSAPNGEIILIAPKILNSSIPGNEKSGLIESENGDLILAAGYALTLSSLDDPDVSFEVQAPENEIINIGQLLAKGGTASVLAGTIRHSGEINADALSVDDRGRVVLSASHRIETTAESVISARGENLIRQAEASADPAAPAPADPVGADGGEVLIKAPAPLPAEYAQNSNSSPAETAVLLAGRVDVTGRNGGTASVEGDAVTVSATIDASGNVNGGMLHVLGDSVVLTEATLTANAVHGNGGQIRVGGEYQGGAALRAAATTTVDGASSLAANAGEHGGGGKVVVWSDKETDFKGSAQTRGGTLGGNGGLVEVSGKEILRFKGSVDVGAPSGDAGTLLLDPKNIFIVPGGATVSVGDSTAATGDKLGRSGFTQISTLANGNILVTNQQADIGGLVDAGKVLLFDSLGNQLGSIGGNATNERLGSLGFFTAAGGNRLFLSPFATAGGLAQAGAVILFDITNGTEIGRTSGTSVMELFGLSGTIDSLGDNFIVGSNLADVSGVDSGSVVTVSGTTGLALGRISGGAAGDQFGSVVTTNFATNTFRIDARLADVGGNADAGAVVTGSAATGLELGRIVGAAANDQFGASVTTNFATNTFRIDAAGADIGGNADAGAVITGSAATGLELGRIAGAAAGDQFGSNVSTFAVAPNTFRIVATGADIGGIVDAGTVIVGNVLTGAEQGRTSGQSTNEAYGTDLYFDTFGDAPSGRMLVLSATADLGGTGNGFDDAGTAVLIDKATGAEVGRTNGLVAGDALGSFDPIMRGSGNYLLEVPDADIGPNADAGSVVLVSGTTGTRIGSVDGNSTNERLGDSSDLDSSSLGFSDALLVSDDHTNGAFTSAGGVFVVADVDLGAGNIVRGSTLGGSADERFGANGVAEFLGSGMLIISETADTGVFTDNGSVVLVAYTGNQVVGGRVDGTSDGEALGTDGVILAFNGNYWIPSTGWEPSPSTPNRGSVILADGTTGAEIGRFDGDTNGEQFGSAGTILQNQLSNGDLIVLATGHNGGSGIVAQLAATDLGSGNIRRGSSTVAGSGPIGLSGGTLETALFDNLGLGDHYAYRAQSNGGNSEGAIFFVDGATGNVIRQIDGLTSDTLGTEALQSVAGGHVAIRSPRSDFAGADSGTIRFVEAFNNYADSSTNFNGAVAGEQFGGSATLINTSSLGSFNSKFLIHATNREISGNSNAGAIMVMSGVAGGSVTQVGSDIGGRATDDRLGGNGASDVQRLFSASNTDEFVIFNPDADVNPASLGLDNEGAVILANQSGAELGRTYGQTLNERFGGNGFGGSGSVIERTNGNYFFLAKQAGVNDEGALYLLDGLDGSLIGKVDGTATNEGFNTFINSFTLTNGDILVGSTSSNAGSFANGGTVVQVADVDLGSGNIIRGRTNGGSAGEQLNVFNAQMAPDGLHYFVRSQLADAAGVDSGAVYFVDLNTGSPTSRLDGLSAGDFFGSSVVASTGGNLIINNQFADVGGVTDAGRYVVANSAGSILGELRGNTINERLGGSTQSVGTESWILAPLHNNGAGAIFAVSDQNLGSGNLVKGTLQGATAGDGIGTFGELPSGQMKSDTRFIRAGNVDVNGLVDAGSVFLVDSLLNVIGRTNGTSANDHHGAGSLFSPNGSTLVLLDPDVDVGAFVDAGAIVQIDPKTGLEIQRTVGISTDERLGAHGTFGLFNGRIGFLSPDADVNGVTDAGRLIFVDPTVANSGAAATDLLFSNTPNGDFVVTTGAIQNALNAGANLILQANTDIVVQKGAVLTATGGSLTLQAGRSILVNGLLNLPETALKLIANESAASGADVINRDSGSGNFVLEDPQVVGKTIELAAQVVRLVGGSDPKAINVPQTSQELFENFLLDGKLSAPATFVLGIEKLSVVADEIELVGGDSPGAFAALVSMGKFTVDATKITLEAGSAPGAHALFIGLGGLGEFTFDECIGCGETLLFTDPFLEDGPTTGRFIAGIFEEPTIGSILSMLDRADGTKDSDEDEDDDDDDTKECGL